MIKNQLYLSVEFQELLQIIWEMYCLYSREITRFQTPAFAKNMAFDMNVSELIKCIHKNQGPWFERNYIIAKVPRHDQNAASF